MPFICRNILIIIAIGIAVRLILGFFMTHGYDMYHWGVVVQNINSGNGLYEITGYFYTPLWGYLLGDISFFQSLMGVGTVGEHVTSAIPIENIAWFFTSTVTTPSFNLSLKMFFFICDIVVGYVIFTVIRSRTKDEKKAILGFALWFLSPAVIAVGAVGEMFDTISVLMTILCIVFLTKDRNIEAGVMFGMAILTKFFPVFLIFVIIAYILRKHKKDGLALKKLIHFSAAAALTALVIFMPQILDGTLEDCFLFITSRVSDGLGGAWGALQQYGTFFAYALVMVVSAVAAYFIYRSEESKLDDLLFTASLLVITVLFIYPYPLPQYTLLLLLFLVFAVVRDRRYLIPWAIISAVAAVYAMTAGPIDLLSVASFTDLLNLDSVMHMIGQYLIPVFGDTKMGWIYLACKYAMLAGILSILWIMFGDLVKRYIGALVKIRQVKE